MKILHKNSNRGASLLTVMALLAITGLIVAGAAKLLDFKAKERKIQKRTDARDFVYDTLRSHLLNPDVILASARDNSPGNRALRNCIYPRKTSGANRANNCTASSTLNPNSPTKFRVLVPHSSGANPTPFTTLSPGDRSARFDKYGLLKDSSCVPGKDCPYFAFAYFYAVCPKKAPQCDIAETIRVIPRVFVYPKATQKWKTEKPGIAAPIAHKPNSREWAASKSARSIEHRASELMLAPEMECPPNQIMVGMKEGKPICNCDFGFKLIKKSVGSSTNTQNLCAPVANKCKVGEVYTGITTSGEPICEQTPSTQYACYSVTTPSSGNSKCRSGYKMRAAQVKNECEVRGNVVHCPDLRLVCCKAK